MLPGKKGDAGRTGRTIACSSTASSGFCGRARIGDDLPERYGKWKTRAQALHPLGQVGRLGRGLRLADSDPTNRYLMLDSHPGPRPPAGRERKGREKGGPESGSGAFPRRTDHQNPSLADSARATTALQSSPPAKSRCPHRPALLDGFKAEGVHRRQGLRLATSSATRSSPTGAEGRHPLEPSRSDPSAMTQRSTTTATASSAASTNSSTFDASPPATTAEQSTSSPSSISPSAMLWMR